MAEEPKFYNLEEVDALALHVLPKAVSSFATIVPVILSTAN